MDSSKMLLVHKTNLIYLQSVKKIVELILSLSPLINVAGCQIMCSFLYFLFPYLRNIDLGGKGHLKSLLLILQKFPLLSHYIFSLIV